MKWGVDGERKREGRELVTGDGGKERGNIKGKWYRCNVCCCFLLASLPVIVRKYK